MMKNKKGFTLIELLAVIIVLAIIIGLTIMAITSYIEKSREGTMNVTAANIIDSVKKDYTFNEQNKRKDYDLLGENSDLVEKNLVTSPWGNKYKEVLVSTTNDKTLICIIDEKGKGIVATEDQILNGEVSQYTVEECQSIFSEKTAEDAITKSDDQTGGVTVIEQEETDSTPRTIEYRYKGKNPNNYIYFNNEMWRIIGVFDTKDINGNITKSIKIIKETPLTETYAWTNTNINNWATSTLKTYLNSTYYESIILKYKNLIKEVTYYLGSTVKGPDFDNRELYEIERDPNMVINNVVVKNAPTWVGKIGLSYMSDYGYATTNCNKSILYYSDDERCLNNNWLYNGMNEWLINSCSDSQNSLHGYATAIKSSGIVNNDVIISIKQKIRPVLYINYDIILLGNGSSVIPFEIEI